MPPAAIDSDRAAISHRCIPLYNVFICCFYFCKVTVFFRENLVLPSLFNLNKTTPGSKIPCLQAHSRKSLIINVLATHHLLACKKPSFKRQKVAFHIMKNHLLQSHHPSGEILIRSLHIIYYINSRRFPRLSVSLSDRFSQELSCRAASHRRESCSGKACLPCVLSQTWQRRPLSLKEQPHKSSC